MHTALCRRVLFGALVLLAGLSQPGPDAAHAQVAACPGAAFAIPTTGRVGWSYRWPFGGGSYHTGVDVFGARGDPILAAAGGKVLAVDDRRVRIRHYELSVDTYYTHLDRVLVSRSQIVTRGQTIGLKGDRGADGLVHLHFSVTRVPAGMADWSWLDERFIENTVDPSPYLRANVNYEAGATDHNRRTIAERCAPAQPAVQLNLTKRLFVPTGPRRTGP